MKKFILPIIFIALFFNRCTIEPYADFTASSNPAEPYEMIYFSNYSSDASQFFWDFGDGYTSTAFEPEHYYEDEGTYTITLTAKHRHGGTDVTRLTIDVYYTQLEVTVAEWNRNYVLNNLIPNAEVTIYATYDDWFNLRHPIETRITNSAGVAFFPHVEPTIYYIDVYHAYYDNEVLGQEDVSYIKTSWLYKAENNAFTAWVDYILPSVQKQRKEIRVPYKMKSEIREFKKTDILK